MSFPIPQVSSRHQELIWKTQRQKEPTVPPTRPQLPSGRPLRLQQKVGSITPRKSSSELCEVRGHMHTRCGTRWFIDQAQRAATDALLWDGEKKSYVCSINVSSARRLNMLLGPGRVSVMPKSHTGARHDLDRCLRDNAGLSQSLRIGDNTSSMRARKAIYRWNGVCDKGCNATVWIHPGLNATVCVCPCCWDNTDCCLIKLGWNLSVYQD